MPFNLRGGRPKNMGQGVYWVQRHLADQKREATRVRRNETTIAMAEVFNERYTRVNNNCVEYHLRHRGSGIEGTQKQADILSDKVESFNTLKAWIDENIEEAKLSHLAKLSTLGRSAIIYCAKLRGQKTEYDNEKKLLIVDGFEMDFS